VVTRRGIHAVYADPLSFGSRCNTGFFISHMAQFQLPDTVMPTHLPDAFVELRGVTCGYGDKVILEDIDLVVPRGKVVALMGTSGGGKTTVLRLIGRQLKAMSGQVLLDGEDMARLEGPALMAARRRMGMLFQLGALFTDLTVFENVAFPLREHTDLPESIIRDLVLMKLNAVGLRGSRDLMPSEISGGMARRVALARAMALDPELMLYDEPFAGLDPISMGVAARLIRDLNDAMGLTSIVVSHDVDETFLIADHVVLLANRRIVAQGTPVQLRQSEDPFVRQFVHARPDGPVQFHQPAVDLAHDFGVAR
jgi:phospholipid/cholesterol/gamma-HCH transport system ATP-binding protein